MPTLEAVDGQTKEQLRGVSIWPSREKALLWRQQVTINRSQRIIDMMDLGDTNRLSTVIFILSLLYCRYFLRLFNDEAGGKTSCFQFSRDNIT